MTRKDRPPKPPAAQPAEAEAPSAAERLQKVLAAAGLGSRRKCEELITTGRVEIDHQVVTELGTKVDATTQEIRVDGQTLKIERPVYYVINKPAGVLSTNYDQEGRTRVVDLIEDNRRLFTVGRLDQSSEGLILVTNDGGLANRLAHPRYGVQKRYHVQVAGHPTEETLAALRRGVRLAEGYVQADDLTIRKSLPKSTVLEMVLGEGKNREIRRMLAKMGHKVVRLIRVALGPLRLADLPSGAYRLLEPQEIRALRSASDGNKTASKAVKKPRKTFARRGPDGKPGGTVGGGRPSKYGAGQGRGREEGRSAARGEQRPPRTFTPRYEGKKQGTIIGGEPGPSATGERPAKPRFAKARPGKKFGGPRGGKPPRGRGAGGKAR